MTLFVHSRLFSIFWGLKIKFNPIPNIKNIVLRTNKTYILIRCLKNTLDSLINNCSLSILHLQLNIKYILLCKNSLVCQTSRQVIDFRLMIRD